MLEIVGRLRFRRIDLTAPVHSTTSCRDILRHLADFLVSMDVGILVDSSRDEEVTVGTSETCRATALRQVGLSSVLKVHQNLTLAQL